MALAEQIYNHTLTLEKVEKRLVKLDCYCIASCSSIFSVAYLYQVHEAELY